MEGDGAFDKGGRGRNVGGVGVGSGERDLARGVDEGWRGGNEDGLGL